MKIGKRLLVSVLCILLLVISWAVALSAQSDTQKQERLISQAEAYLADEVYVRAEPLLEEAGGYHGNLTQRAEELLKQVYVALIDQQGYSMKYEDLLNSQMSRKDATEEVFLESAKYYLQRGEVKSALDILKRGIDRFNSDTLSNYYEENRYDYSIGLNAYEDVTVGLNGGIQVKLDGLWGLAKTNGTLILPCEYDKVSTYYDGEILTRKGSVISAVTTANNRWALLHQEADDFSNYNDGRAWLHMSDGWHITNSELEVGEKAYSNVGMFSGGYAAVSENGRWGVRDVSGEWYIPPEHDGIVMDELGRCYGQDAVFARDGEQVRLFVKGQQIGESYDDARPFGQTGYAAVKRGDEWGFIDPQGNVVIDFAYVDARSFSQHLAAVATEDGWGYISLQGKLVIEPMFGGAKDFCNGSAPIRTVDGWEFLTLKEYETEGLL